MKYALLLIVVVAALYGQTFSFGYVGLDEEELIVQRQGFLRNPANIPVIFTHDVSYPNKTSPYYRPMLTLSFMADAMIGGTSNVVAHLTNVLLHIVAVLLLWRFFIALGIEKSKSFFYSLIFAVHPVFSQAVAWVPGRNDTLLAVFVLSSCIFFLKSLRLRSWKPHAVHFALFALALLTKETAVVVPIIIIGIWLWFSGVPFSWRRFWSYAVPWMILLVIWYAVRAHALSSIPGKSLSAMLSQILGYAPQVVVYLGKIILPFQLSVMPSAGDSVIWFGLGALIILCALVYISRKYLRSSQVFFGACWFLSFLVPSLISYDDPSRVVFFEHRLYLPLIGVLLIFALLPGRVWKIGAPILVGFAVLAFFHVRTFRSEISFWEQAVSSSPSMARARNSLGVAYANAGRLGDAFQEYQTAYRMTPDDYLINTSLGNAYRLRREPALAEEHLKKAISINPARAPAHHYLGFLYATQKRFSEAEQEWFLALQYNSQYAPPHEALAVYYAQVGRFEESIVHIRAIMELGAPVLPELMNILQTHQQP
ncbi:MAG: tetratricopeptide repeat protein [Patescibacteria group bacterium]